MRSVLSDMDRSCVFVLFLCFLHIVHVSGQTPSLTGPTSGVLGSSVHLICTIPGSSAIGGGLIFTRSGVAGSLCAVNIATRSQFRALGNFSCGFVSGQTREFYLNISLLSQQDDDTRSCSYSGVSSNNISLSVYYAPEISSSFPNIKDVTDNSSPNIDCSSSLTAGNPSDTSYTWSGPGGYSKSGPVLDRRVIRSQGGSYTCTARNSAGLSDSAQVNINVQYSPEISSSFPNNKDVTENSSPNIDCSSGLIAGNPSDTSYIWTGPVAYSKSGYVLDRRVSRSQGGSYSCTVRNSAGLSDSAQVNINVQYIDVPVLTISPQEVMENASVHLECRVSSNPTVELTIGNLDNNTDLVDGEMTNTRQLGIDRAQCLHNGTFQCVVNNRALSRSESVTTELQVLCLPRYDYRKQHYTSVAAKLYETVELVAEVIANPFPNFTWGRLEGDDLVPISSSAISLVHSSKLKSVLQINVASSKDYGQYAVKVKNMVGEILLKYHLTAIGSPFLPTNFRASSVGPTSVTLEWTSNYNGGAPQIFHLEFRSFVNNWINTLKNGIPDHGKDARVSTEVTGLQSSTRYSLTLFSTNIYGNSGKVTINVSTLEAADTYKESSNVGVIAGVIPAVCLLTVLFHVLFFLYRRGVLQEPRCLNSQKDGQSNSNPVPEVQAASTSPYSDLDYTTSERQAYAALNTYQNQQTISKFNQSISMSSSTSPTYENTAMDKKDPLYVNASSKLQK